MVMLGFKWPPVTGLKARMKSESRMKFDTPPTRAPRNTVVEKTPAAVVGVGTGAVDGLNEIHVVRKTISIVPVVVSLSLSYVVAYMERVHQCPQ